MVKFPSFGWTSRFGFSALAPVWYEKSLIKSSEVNSYVDTRLKKFTFELYQKANHKIREYYILQNIIIIVSALIPIINVLYIPDEGLIRFISAILGGIIAVSAGIIQLMKLRESGIVFRIITSRLQREYHTYVLATDIYNIKDEQKRDKLFIHNAEVLIMNATTEYYDLFRETKTSPSKPSNING